jgi:branched-chain amino acid transport system permease protein
MSPAGPAPTMATWVRMAGILWYQRAMASFVGVIFDGIAYGSLLFLVSVGLSVTMGLMNFINLAHGAFAMFGGYLAVWLMMRWGVPFLATLPIAFAVLAAVGAVLERTLYRRLYGSTPLDQVLFTIGLTFMAMAAATWFWGSGQQPLSLPSFLRGQLSAGGVDFGAYRLFLVAFVIAITAALVLLIERTRFGSQVRAAVDQRAVASALGIRVDRVFSLMFALGSGLAGLGGALGIEVLGLDSSFPLKFMVYFLLVVVVGGAGTIHGAAIAAIVLGIFDVAGKYYFPQVGAFIIYALMVVLLIAFPRGLFGRRT